MSNAYTPVLKSKSVIITFLLTVLSLIYRLIDAAGNVEFMLQKIGVDERVAKFLGSSRGIDFLMTGSLLALVLIVAYKMVRHQGALPNQTAPQEETAAPDAKPSETQTAELTAKGAEIQRLSADVEEKDNRIEEREAESSAPGWINAIVDYQRRGLRKYVLVEKCEVNASPLLKGKRYVEFTFHVRNYSMFHATIPMSMDAPVEGSIYFKGDRLSGTAKLVENKVVKLRPYLLEPLKIHQWVDADEVKDIPETLDNVGNLFDFSKATIYIKADEFPNDKADTLDLTRGMQNAGLENGIIELKNTNAQLRGEIATWRERAGYIEELYLALGACYQAYNQAERREALSKEVFENLKMRISHALSYRPNEPKSQSDFYDELPSIPDEPGEQKGWIDAQCFNLRALIEEEHHKLFGDQNEGSMPNS
jgi:hypothetical protein